MKSLWSFLIVVLAVKTSMLPSAYAQDCTEGCMSCKVKTGCDENNEPEPDEECPANEACTLLNGIPSCVPFAQTSCDCDGGRQGCDPIDNTKIIYCAEGNLYSKGCPDGQQCTGTGQCVATTPDGGEGSGSRNQDSDLKDQGGSSREEDSVTTKPETCSEENEYMRYPHETDCKKFYTCRKITLTRYGYVSSTCFGNLVYDKVNKYCELPHNVPDCQQ